MTKSATLDPVNGNIVVVDQLNANESSVWNLRPDQAEAHITSFQASLTPLPAADVQMIINVAARWRQRNRPTPF